MSPTQRALKFCKDQGWTAAITEKWNPHAHIRQDLFGIIDLVVLADSSILGVQVCAGASHAARQTKAESEPRLKTWLLCGGHFEVWSFSKRGARGKRKLWQRRVTTAGISEGALVWCDLDESSLVNLDECRAIG